MADVLLLLLTVVFFALCWLYVRACERVWGERHEPRIPDRLDPVRPAPRVPCVRPLEAGALL